MINKLSYFSVFLNFNPMQPKEIHELQPKSQQFNSFKCVK